MPPLPFDDGRNERLRILDAMATALADPARLIGILVEAADDDDAIARLVDAYAVDSVGAQALLDLQVRRVIPVHRVRITEELRVLRAEWGPAIDAQVQFSGRRCAVVSIEDAQHTFRAGGVNAVLERLGRFLLEEVATPRLRPVTAAVTGLPDGPIRITYTPGGGARAEYRDDPAQIAR